MSSSFQVVVDNKKKAMKRLTCRKCEGHGHYAILKGHAGVCPYKDCSCGTCTSVMSMRANALIRRFRHRQPDQSMAVVKALRSKNGNMRLRIVARNEETLVENDGTLVTYSNDKNGHQTYTTTHNQNQLQIVSEENTIRRSSILTNDDRDDQESLISTPPSTTNNSTPSGSPPLLSPYGDVIEPAMDPVASLLRTALIQQLLANPAAISPATLSLLFQPAPAPQFQLNTNFCPNIPPVLFPISL